MSVPSFIRIERDQMGAHDFKLNKVPLFALKSVNINVSLSAASKPPSEPLSILMTLGTDIVVLPVYIAVITASWHKS